VTRLTSSWAASASADHVEMCAMRRLTRLATGPLRGHR